MDLSGMAGTIVELDELGENNNLMETTGSSSTLGALESFSGINSTISAGYSHTCMIVDNGSIYCWGDNDEGALGNDNINVDSGTPVQVYFSSGYSYSQTAVAISSGNYFTCALMDDGAVVCWGQGSHHVNNGESSNNDRGHPTGAIPLGGAAVSITTGYRHACAVLENGSAYCWGYGYYGQIGNNQRSESNSVSQVNLPIGYSAVSIHSGVQSQTNCVIMSDNSSWCWGKNDYGQTGVGYDCDSGEYTGGCNGYSGLSSPKRVTALPSNFIPTKIVTGVSSSCFLSTNYEIRCTGYMPSWGGWVNTENSGHTISITHGVMHGQTTVQAIDFTFQENSFCIITIVFDTICAGNHNNARTGLNLTDSSNSARWSDFGNPSYTMLNNMDYYQDEPQGAEVTSVTSGYDHGCRVLSNSTVECWGYNYDGRAGNGSMGGLPVLNPEEITGNFQVKTFNLDSDNDGILSSFENCPSGVTGWTSNSITDIDSDGCRDSDEDDDDDGDGYSDSLDAWPTDPYSYRNLTSLNSFIPGVRYDNITAGGTYFLEENGCYALLSNSSVKVCDDKVIRSLSTQGKIRIYNDGTTSESILNTGVAVTSVVEHSNTDSESHISSSYATTCAIYVNHVLACLGNNDYGILADGTTTARSTLQNISFPIGSGNPSSLALQSHYYNPSRGICVLMDLGDVYCWGDSSIVGFPNACSIYASDCIGSKLLAPKSKVQFSTNNQTTSNASAVSIFSNMDNSVGIFCSVHSDGTASCWGDQESGQMGNGYVYSGSTTPKFVILPQGSGSVISMALSRKYSCSLMDDGEIYCWGKNDHGQLGDGTRCLEQDFTNNCNGNYVKPIAYEPVALPNGTHAISIFSHNIYDVCAILNNNRVFCWGEQYSYNGHGTYLTLGSEFIQIGNRDWDSDGIYNNLDNCAAGINGWISNLSIDGDADGCIDSTEDTDDDGDGYTDTNEIDCGTDPLNSSDIPLDADMDGLCNTFDDDDDGDGTLDIDDYFPNDPYGFVHLTLGDGFQSGQPLDNVSLGGSSITNCMILNDFSIKCWGGNQYGQIGDGTRGADRYAAVAVNLPVGLQPRSLSSSSSANHICSVMVDGSLYCWGNNQYGQIGDGTNCESNNYANGCNGVGGRSVPIEVSLPIGRTATAVTTGATHTCAIMDDGSVWCWGSNSNGKLGVGNSSSGTPSWTFTPQQVLLPSERTAIAISSGYHHSCAVLDNNSIVCWGLNDHYQLGNWNSGFSTIPTHVSTSQGLSFNSIASGKYHNCAITNDNNAYCWGQNYYYQLGDATSTYRGDSATLKLVTLPVGRQAMGLSLGEYSSCSILDDESSYCWGNDYANQLNTQYECQSGDYSNGCTDGYRSTPAESISPIGRSYIAIFRGASHACMAVDNGGIYCFGYNGGGPLGNGSTNGNGPNYVHIGYNLSVLTSDRDSDNDGIFNNGDRCLNGATGWTSNSSTDNDFDGCRDSDEDLDDDNDDWTDTDELACGTQSLDSTSVPLDTDGDLTCNIVDTDDDNDSLIDTSDDCSAGEIGWISNSSTDYDSDGCQDSGEDTDDDNDSISDTYDSCTPGELSWTSSTSTDYDTDGCQDSSEDTDDDNDNVTDSLDLCPTGQLGWSSDSSTDNDGDGCKDSTSEDLDDDNDGWSDADETACGTQTLDSSSIPLDTDGDLTCDVVDTDDDNDGYLDSNDEFPLDSTEWVDTDNDGTGNNADTDDDNDGWSDALEISCGTLPLDSSSTPIDTDSDGTCNSLDTDDDNDGVLDTNDAFPLDNTEWDDTDSDGTGNNADLDDDGDGWTDTEEVSCGTLPLDSSSTPVDTDLDGICNSLDVDDDNDGILDIDDAFPFDSTEWEDTDGDGLGNNADTDDDNDGVLDTNDTFPLDNNEWLDTDNDSIGNNADLDDDGDGWNDAVEISCGTDSLNSSSIPDDTDLDGICNTLDDDDDNDGFNDGNDTFPLDDNEWLDTDNDSIGNNADLDDDNDGWNDTAEISCGTDSLNASSIPTDTDGDGICDTRDPDDDNDGYLDSNDSFPLDNTEWADTDNDSIGNNADLDDDGDNVTDSSDAFPLDGTEWEDTDGDGIGNNADTDDDNDGLSDSAEFGLGTNSTNPDTDGDNYTDGSDAFPLDGTEWEDTDGDGIGNNADLDDDADSWDDLTELSCASDPLDNSSIPLDTDNDGDCDLQDTDDDNDGTLDVDDAFPLDASADTDTDSDGMPDIINGTTTTNLTEDWDDDNDGWNDTIEINCGYDPLDYNDIPIDSDNDTVCDTLDIFPNDPSEWEDTDGDGYGDNGDAFPTDSSEWNDTDGDGIGDNADPDADNDGWFDNEENQCNSDWLNSSSVPSDVDNDGLCNEMDSDADDDGWSNDDESDCFTDWLDDADIPLDTDGDSLCDVVDGDDDNDLYPDDQDAFPLDYLEWEDSDSDGIGNNQDPDDDNDGCMDIVDSHPIDPTECSDNDGDGYGDNADPDDDNDGTLDYFDDFPFDASATTDTDGDGMPDDIFGNSTTGLVEDFDDDNDGYNDTDDAFPLDLNEWIDTDGDGLGNNADPDDDGDSCADVIDLFPLNPAECYDYDLDGIGDNADLDDDNDGWEDNTELICGTSSPFDPLDTPDDFDQDGICDILDYDDDNDTIIDAQDAFPFNPCASIDTDGDGLPDFLVLNCNTTLTEDLDDDNDGYNDTNDSFPQDPNEWSDFDNDGYGDNYDTDDDGDTVPDIIDSFPLNSSEWFDNDGDGIGDNSDTDDDNDGILDVDDDFPFDFGITTDTDGDGLPDNMTSGYNGSLSEDLDDDGDGVLDIYDQFPLDATEWMDTDLDGIGNNADSDDDGDGWSDNDEWVCGTDTLDANDIPDDSDGDGICDSEDEEDLTTLTGRAEYYLKAPVTVWMALVGIIAGMLGGATSTSFRARKEREQLYSEMRDFTDSVRDYEDYDKPMRPMKTVSITESKDSEIKKLVDQGYSEEVAEALINSQR